MLLPPDNTYDAINGAVSFGANYEKDKRYKFKGNLLYNGSMLDALSNSVQTYYNNDIKNQADIRDQNRNHFITASLQETWKPNTEFELSSNTRFNFGNYENKQYTNNSFASDSFYANELRDSKSYNVTQELNTNYKAGTGILYAYVGLDIVSRDENYSLITDSLLFSTTIPSLGYNVNDDILEKRLSVNTEIGYILPIYKDINLNTSLSYHYNAIDYSYKIPMSENINSNQYAYRANVRFEKAKGLFRFTVGGLVKWDDFNINTTKGSYSKCMVEPNASLSLVFNPKHKLSLGASYNQMPYSINHFSDTTRIISYNQSLGKSEISDPFNKNANISLQYFIFDLYSRTSLFVYSNYTHTNNAPLMNIQQSGITNSIHYSNGGETDLFMSKILISKGLGFIPADIKLDASNTYTKTLSSINQILSTTSSNNTNVGLSIYSRFKSIINFEIGARYRHLYDESKAFNTNSHLNEWGANIKMKFAYKKFNANVYCSYDNINTNYYSQNFTDVGFHIGYDFKWFGIRVSGKNLLNMDKMEWITTTSNELFTSDIYYRKIPGSILLSLVYNF